MSSLLSVSVNSKRLFSLRNDLEYRYEKTAKELELKRNEVVNLTKEYEQRIRIKEVMQFKRPVCTKSCYFCCVFRQLFFSLLRV